jgi:hypothetical protein
MLLAGLVIFKIFTNVSFKILLINVKEDFIINRGGILNKFHQKTIRPKNTDSSNNSL